MLALKTVALEFFTEMKYFFIIHDFWATYACPENRVCPEIFQAHAFDETYFTSRGWTKLSLLLLCKWRADIFCYFLKNHILLFIALL